MKNVFLLIAAALLLSSCGMSSPVYMPSSALDSSSALPDAPRDQRTGLVRAGAIDSLPDVLPDVGGNTKDAVIKFSDSGVARESIIASTWKTLAKVYQKMYEKSGMVMEYAMVDVGNGVKALLPSKMTYRERPDLSAFNRMATKPADHPGWKVLDNSIKTVTLGILGYKGIDELGGFLTGLVSGQASADTYNGPVIKSQSDNKVGRDYNVGDYNGPIKLGDDSQVVFQPTDKGTEEAAAE